MENASLLLKMARDLAIPPVAVQPVNTGGGSSGYQHLDAGDAGPPSPDRVERSSSESSDEVDYGGGGEEAEEGEALYRQFLARRMAEERLMDNGISSMDGRRRGRRRRLDFEGQITPRHEEVREDLATLAERFARSEGREAVRRRADQVELRSITQDNFSQLLSELFHDGGVTQAKILSPYYGIPLILCNSGANPGSLLLLLRPCLAGNQSWSPCHSLQTDKVILSQSINKVYEKMFSKDSTQWCRTKSRSNKIYHWRFIHRWKRLCGTFQKQLTKKYGTGIFWNPGKIWHFWCFLAFFGVFGCHFHSAVLFLRVFGTAYDIYPPQTSA